jgi:hypothetical protein
MALGDIALMLQPMIDSATDMTGAFVPMGRTFLGIAITIAAVLAIYEWWMGGVQGALAKLTRALIVLSIPLTLFYGDNYAKTMGTVRDFFAVGMTQPIIGGSAGGGPEVLRNTINTLTTSMFPRMRESDPPAAASSGGGGIVGWAKEAWAGVSGPVDALFRLNVTVRQMLYDGILMVVAGFVSLALVFALYGPLLALQIGIIFGPLLIAWLPSPQFSHLAKSWLQFILTQGFTLVVSVAIAVIGANAITAFAVQMNALAGGGVSESGFIEAMIVQAGGFIASISVLVFVGIMLFKADSIAGALLGGGGGGSSAVGAAMLARLNPSKLVSKGGIKKP